MCHSTDSRPPAAPVTTGAVAEHGRLELTAADGNRFTAYRAKPTVPLGRSIVLLPDRRGLHPFYEGLAQRFAEAGFDTLALDYYGRTAGTGPRDDDFDRSVHLPLLEPGHVAADTAAAVARLRADGDAPVFTVGFCLGGAHSWQLAQDAGLGLAGAVGFYGALRFMGEQADQAAPLLMLLAGADEFTAPEEFAEFTAGLDRAGREYEVQVYEGAPHSYFDDEYTEWQEACTDSWHRMLAFTERHAGTEG